MSGEVTRTWFAMRATYGRNLMAQRALELDKIESFVPMRKRTIKVGRRVKTDLIPVVRDLIFVLGEREVVQEAKGKIPYLHYIVRPAEGKIVPVEVPEEQMQQFIAVCNEMDDDAELFSGEEAHFEIGERVEVINGTFKGHQHIWCFYIHSELRKKWAKFWIMTIYRSIEIPAIGTVAVFCHLTG